MIRQCAIWLALVPMGACGDPRAPSPESTLEVFLDLMERGRTDPGALQEAYDLLDPEARASLASRARQANTLARRQFAPWQMIAAGRHRLRITPTAMQAHIDGDSALVVVRDARDDSRAEVPMVKEDGRWRVKLSIPGMPAPAAAAPPSIPGAVSGPGVVPGSRPNRTP